MEYFDFVNHIKEAMVDFFGQSAKICINKVVKNNDLELDALSVFTKDEIVTPTVYLNYYYEQYKKGRKFEEILGEIAYIFDDRYNGLQFDVEEFIDFKFVKERIIFKLVNRKLNERFLNDVPFVPVLDLAIVFMYMLDTGQNGNAVAVIHKEHMEMWGIDKKTLYETAMENTPKLLPSVLMPMNEILTEYMESVDLPKEYVFLTKMWILTNKAKFYGAGVMLYENELFNLAEELKSNLIILPSSVHEIIVVQDNGDGDINEVERTIGEVNERGLSTTDVLSNRAYYYDFKQKKLSFWE